MIAIAATARPMRRKGLTGLLLLLVLAVSSWLLAQGPGQGGFFIPGDAKSGLQTFFDKGCARCHSILGEGGKAAPDLARAPTGYLSASGLVADMWNHAPQMWERMHQQSVEHPTFSEVEMSNLFAFLYSVRSLDEPGDPERGWQLLFNKRCLECHAVEGEGGHAGPDLRDWASYRNPVSWIQAMWNHAPAMQALMQQRGVSWPEFQGSDVADLIAYIRTQATNPRRHVYLEPADPDLGRVLFTRKGCANCHRLRGPGGTGAPALGSGSLPRTLGQFAGSMWNHSPAMWARMKAQNIPRPQFSNKEMADLISYLLAESYFEASGNLAQGRRVFEVKGCVSCHLTSGKGVGPALTPWRGHVSPSALATAMWNHGPVMLERMREKQLPWPYLRPQEMTDLMEYINRGVTSAAPSGGQP